MKFEFFHRRTVKKQPRKTRAIYNIMKKYIINCTTKTNKCQYFSVKKAKYLIFSILFSLLWDTYRTKNL